MLKYLMALLLCVNTVYSKDSLKGYIFGELHNGEQIVLPNAKVYWMGTNRVYFM